MTRIQAIFAAIVILSGAAYGAFKAGQALGYSDAMRDAAQARIEAINNDRSRDDEVQNLDNDDLRGLACQWLPNGCQ